LRNAVGVLIPKGHEVDGFPAQRAQYD